MNTVILAGGASSRFYPFNRISKAVFELMGKPILRHTVDNLMKVGLKEITVVKSGDFDNWNLNVSFVEQKDANGQADAIFCAISKMKQISPILVLNAQHFTASKVISKMIKLYKKTSKSVILSIKTDEPGKYGIIGFRGDKVTQVVEKPATGNAPSNLRVVGIYLLTLEAIEIIKSLPLSQYQLEEGLDLAAKKGKLIHMETKEEMPSLKYPWDVLRIKDILLGNRQFIDKTAFVHKTALIEGPCWIGPKAVVGAYCILRKGVILEESAEIQRYVEIKNSVIGKNSHFHSGYIGDSVIGENCRIGAGFITANRRFDRKNISAKIKGEMVNSGLTSLGVMMGNGVKIGIQCGTMPGTVIEAGSALQPGEIANGLVKALQ